LPARRGMREPSGEFLVTACDDHDEHRLCHGNGGEQPTDDHASAGEGHDCQGRHEHRHEPSQDQHCPHRSHHDLLTEPSWPAKVSDP